MNLTYIVFIVCFFFIYIRGAEVLLLCNCGLFSSADLKRNEYTPDKVTFPQEDPSNLGGSIKEAH